ncbi:hypothetical protein KSF78_0006629 [Schistosoma japonicum]|nr:hypothetical protein KSF78_0006629 [Schistosoma japonicum]
MNNNLMNCCHIYGQEAPRLLEDSRIQEYLKHKKNLLACHMMMMTKKKKKKMMMMSVMVTVDKMEVVKKQILPAPMLIMNLHIQSTKKYFYHKSMLLSITMQTLFLLLLVRGIILVIIMPQPSRLYSMLMHWEMS